MRRFFRGEALVRRLYTLLLWLLLPFVFVRLWQRARRQPEYLRHTGERFGLYKVNSDKPVIWLHAVSVGETRATVNLVGKLRAAYPEFQILLTHTTPTGRATSEQLYGEGVMRVYLPYDYPFAVRRFLRHFKPRLGILMETEIWFNLIHEGHEAAIPMLLLNARLSEKSARGYARVAGLAKAALQELTVVAAQTADDAARLTQLGAREVSIMGNLKFDIAPPEAMLKLGKNLREQFGANHFDKFSTGRKVFLAASTREGEEALLLDAWHPLPKPSPTGGRGWPTGRERVKNESVPLLVIVPRHPQRFSDIADMLIKRGVTYQRRSENRQVESSVQVVLGDSMGEMFAYYAACDIAFIGGSLLPFGAQNLIEACAVGAPVVIGPSSFNFAEAARLAIKAGAAIQVDDAAQLMLTVQKLLDDESALRSMSEQGIRFVAAHRGATDKAAELISQYFFG